MSIETTERYVLPKFWDATSNEYKPIIPEATEEKAGSVYLSDTPNSAYDSSHPVALTPKALDILYKGLRLSLDGETVSGTIPADLLPSSLDDVIEGYYYNKVFYFDSAHTKEITPSTGIIYVDLTGNKTYRWSGSQYIAISSTLEGTIGSNNQPIYLQNGVLTAVTTSIGSDTQPVYFDKGVIKASSNTLATSVPSGAKFTDTIISKIETVSTGNNININITDSANKTVSTTIQPFSTNKPGIVPTAPTDGSKIKFLRADGSWQIINDVCYGECSTAKATIAKTLTNIEGFSELRKGLYLIVKFINGNSSTTPTLSINNSAAHSITATDYEWEANTTLLFVYNGDNWVCVSGSGNSNITFSAGTVQDQKIKGINFTTPSGSPIAITGSVVSTSSTGSAKFDIAEKSITATHIATNAVTSGAIDSGAIIASKIATNAVTSGAIDSGSITTTHLQNGAITTNKIATNTITAGNIAASTITSGNIATGTITSGNIATGTITSGNIATGAITAGVVSSNSITLAKLSSDIGTVTVTTSAPPSTGVDSRIKIWIQTQY